MSRADKALYAVLSLLVALTFIVLAVGAARGAQANLKGNPTIVRCEEDMPCWDCSTMGNRICGK